MPDQLREPLSLLPRCSEPWIWISKPGESSVKKFIRRRRASTCPLPVERPPKDELRSAILFNCHASKPMIKEGGFPDTTPCNDCDDVDILVRSCTIKKSDILLPTEHVASCNGQSGY